ncbi:DUF3299 domain-containing protein [Magnetococcales bacterium HHB-1]
MSRSLPLILLFIILLSGCSQESEHQEQTDHTKPVMELKWGDLVPDNFHPEKMFEGMDLTLLEDTDPKVQKLMERYVAEINRAPTNPELNGRQIKIPGFVVPLETHGEITTEFLLVPYFGACIHTPPPPSNQVIHVKAIHQETQKSRAWYDTVWVTGMLYIERHEHDIGTASYAIHAKQITPYEPPTPPEVNADYDDLDSDKEL